jgi:hypothetical protein
MPKLKTTDICFLIPSYNRYDKLKNILNQIFEYKGVGTIVYDDCSKDERYLTLSNEYDNLKVLRGASNNGKGKYNETVKSLFREAMLSDYKYFVFIADDMILCKDFIENIIPLLSEHQIVNLFSLSAGGWNCSSYIDGVFTISKPAIGFMYNAIPKKLVNRDNKSTGVWEAVTVYFCRENTGDYKLTSLNYTLVQHDGNDDSKLHPKLRLVRPITALNFYDNYFGNQIIQISQSIYGYGLKKKRKDISNGNIENQIIKNATNENGEVVKNNSENKTPVINSQVSNGKEKLYNPEKPKPISRINNDIMVGKLRKKNLKFGRR